MPVYFLEPIDLNHRDWEASIYKGPCTIRTDDPDRARQIAKHAFWITTDSPQKMVPWNNSSQVKVSLLTDHNYEEDGQEEILEPPGYNENWREIEFAP